MNNLLEPFGIDIIFDEIIDRNDTIVEAYILKLCVYNKTSESKKVKILNSNYLTSKREQLEQDYFESGFMKDEDSLLPKSFKKTALVYYKPKLKRITIGDILSFNIELVQDGIKLVIDFEKKGNIWEIINISNTSIPIKKSNKELEKYLLSHIERLEVFEERLNVNIQNISLKVYNGSYSYIEIFCELHSINGSTINKHLQLEYILYDKEGSIMKVAVYSISSEKFFGFELCNKQIGCENIEEIGKIRIYPHS
jgi:hypothetical protein